MLATFGDTFATITIEGFGEVEVKIPEELEDHEDIFLDSVVEAIAQTCQLMKPNAKGEFRPVLGFADGS